LKSIQYPTIRTAEFVGDFASGSDEWLELRKQGITGTDVGTLLGVNPYESAYALYHKKLNLIDDRVPDNNRMKLGRFLETPLLDMFQDNHPELTIVTVGTYRHKERTWQIANPDALAYDGDKLYIVEVKTSRQYWDDIPPHYKAQTLHYCDVFDADGIIFVTLEGGDYKEYFVDRDEDAIEVQRGLSETFWEDNLANEIVPDWDGSESTYNTVRELSEASDEGSVDLGDLGMHLVNKNTEIEKLTKELNELKARALDAMQHAKYGVVEYEGVEYSACVKRQRGEGKPYLQIEKGKSWN
jgi:putative phage-type endonuclease